MRIVVLGLAAAAVGLGAAASPAVVQLMKTQVDPASNAVFAVQGDVDPGNEDAAKVPAQRWAEGMAAAAKLKAAAAKLQGPLVHDEALWKAEAGKMAQAAEAARAAAAAHDGARFSDAANALGDTCSACHAKYRPQS